MSTAQSLRLQVILGAVDKLTRPLQGMMQSSSGLSRAVKEARDRLRDLEQQQNRIGKFEKTVQGAREASAAIRSARDAVSGYTKKLDDHRLSQQETAGKVRAARAELKQLLTQMNATGSATQGLNARYNVAKHALEKLETAYAQAQSKTRGLKESVNQANKELATSTARKKALSEALRNQARDLEAAGIGTKKLGDKTAKLANDVERANSQLTTHGQRLAQVRERQQAWNRAMETRNQLLNAGATMMAAGVAMGAPVLAAVKNFATFEDAMLGVAKQVEGARDDNGQLTRTYYEMADAIRTLSTDARIGQTAVQIAALVEAGARMGIQGADNLLAYARTAGMAATAFSAMADQIGEDIAKVANLYNIPIANIGALGDTINWLDDNAQSKGGDIINVLTRIAGISQTVKMSFQDAAALGSTFLSLGASAEVAATGANALIRELAIATQQPARFKEALKSIGLAPDAVQAGMLKDSTGTILRVLEAIKALPEENQLATTVGLFGKEYGDDVAKIAGNLGEYRRQLALANSEQVKGSMAREADARAMALSARWQTALSRLFNASSRAGETLKGTLVGIIDAAGSAIDGIDGLMQRNPGLTSALMHAAGALAAVVAGLGALALGFAAVAGPIAVIKLSLGVIAPVLAGILAPVIAVIGKLAILKVGLGAVAAAAGLISTPVLAVTAAVTALGAAIWAAYNAWEKLSSGKATSVKFGDIYSGGATVPLRAPGVGAGNVTTSNAVTINAAPGQNPQDIGKEVTRQLDERERFRQARRRSILGDVD